MSAVPGSCGTLARIVWNRWLFIVDAINVSCPAVEGITQQSGSRLVMIVVPTSHVLACGSVSKTRSREEPDPSHARRCGPPQIVRRRRLQVGQMVAEQHRHGHRQHDLLDGCCRQAKGTRGRLVACVASAGRNNSRPDWRAARMASTILGNVSGIVHVGSAESSDSWSLVNRRTSPGRCAVTSTSISMSFMSARMSLASSARRHARISASSSTRLRAWR